MKKRHATILKHHRHSSVYVDGRYLHVDTKVSLKSKRGRQLAMETAMVIIDAVGEANEATRKPDALASPRDTSDDQA